VLINWFSPLPPARSGIAHYAIELLPILARQHEVVLWTDQEQVFPDAPGGARIVRYDPAAPPWREINEGEISIYHLGNHPAFHAGIWRVSTQQPGIVVLHDLSLHDFFSIAVHTGQDRASYLAAMQRWYGAEGRRSAEAYCAGGISPESMAQQYPLVREAVHNALGVITHSRQALEEFRETPACPVTTLDLPYAARNRLITDRALCPPYRLITFGHLSRNRRLGPLLEAWAGMRERDQFRLDICGQIWDESHIRREVERCGLSSNVNLHGFLPENQLDLKLRGAHLAVNLRYPSMGEASLSQLQYWDYALPTLVTRTGWYASLPEDATAFVRPEHEVEDIQAHLRAFLNDPAAFQAMGRRGRGYLACHDPQKYVEALVQFASAALEQAPRAVARELARKTGADLSAWLHPAASAYLLDRASQEIAALFKQS
jgi:glycosyltransferase involved in cell wall biosynthesis